MAKKTGVRRQRGFVLTQSGLQRLQQARQEIEIRSNAGNSLSLEQIAERSELDVHTVRRALSGTDRVDRSTLVQLFQGFALELEEADRVKPERPRRQDWGKAIFGEGFLGRDRELETLARWVGQERCRVIAIYGVAGIGKTSLALEAARQWQDRFENIVWRSLQDPVPPEQLLRDVLAFLAPEDRRDPETTFAALLAELLRCFERQRCLLILDNVESLFREDVRAGEYLPEWAAYGELFDGIGTAQHKSNLLLTSQVEPREIAAAEGADASVRSLRLGGIASCDVSELLVERQLEASSEDLTRLTQQYGGNPLILSLTFATVRDIFAGSVREFLAQDFSVYGDLRDLLAFQLERLSEAERDVLFWLAVAREPLPVTQIFHNSLLPASRLTEALESLFRRAILERRGSLLSCQHVILEYVTELLIDEVCDELASGELRYLHSHPLFIAHARDSVREAQRRVFLQPLLDKLAAHWQSRSQVVATLTQLLENLRESQEPFPSYAAGNLVNLLRQSEVVFPNWNFSGLALWQADFEGLMLQGCDFRRTDLRGTRFTQYLGGVCDVAFSPDGVLFAAGDTNGELHIFRAQDGDRLLQTSQGDWLWSVTFSPDGLLLACGSESHDIELWDVVINERFGTLRGHEGGVRTLQFAPHGNLLASGSDDGTVRLWDVESGCCLHVISGESRAIETLCFSSDGRLLASSSGTTVEIWAVDSGRNLGTLAQSEGISVRALVFHPQGYRLAGGCDDGTVRYWDLTETPSQAELLCTFDGHKLGVTALAMSADGTYLASSSDDKTVRLWQLATGTCKQTLCGHRTGVSSVAFSPDGDVLASGSLDCTIQLWNTRGQSIYSYRGRGSGTWGIAFDRTGDLLAASRQDRADLWEASTGDRQRELSAKQARLTAIDFSPDGQHVASGSFDGAIRIWETDSGRSLESLRGQRERILSLAFSPNNQWLASSSEDTTVALWNWQDRCQHQLYEACDRRVWSVAFSPDSKRLVCGSHDGSVRLLEVTTGDCIWVGTQHQSWTWSVAFSPDGRYIASGSQDGSLKLWDAGTGDCVRTIEVGQYVFAVAFGAGGRLLASGRNDGKIDLWDPEDGRRQATLPGHERSVWTLEASPNGNMLASTDGDEAIFLWDLAAATRLQAFGSPRPYEGMNIAGVKGLTAARRENLKALGAIIAGDGTP